MGFSLKIPTNKEIEEAVSSWGNIDWRNISLEETDRHIKEIQTRLITLYGIFPRLHNYSNTEKLLHRKVYRVRGCDVNMNEELISEFSYKPISAPKSLGRADFPYYPVFYGSPNQATALSELIETNGNKFNSLKENTFYLSEWTFKESTPLNTMWFTYGKYNPEHDLSLFSKHYIKDLQEQINAISEEEKKLLDEVLESISNLFLTDKINAFAACMAYIHLYHKGADRTELFIYPSIRNDKGALNYAIHPNTVYHKMYLQKVYKLKIIDFEKDEKGKMIFVFDNLEEFKCGRNNLNGHLIWNKFEESDIKEFKTLFPPA